MATKIKRTLYVGLGGTGMLSLLHTKKLLMETYGEIPPMIGFIGIDTDKAAYTKTLPSKYGPVSFLPGEQLPIMEDHPKEIFLKNRDRLTWIPDTNAEVLTRLSEGAGQVRTNGRFAFAMKYEQAVRKVEQVLTNICRADIAQNRNYELLGKDVDICLVFSIAGGTGCGTFIDVAYMLKNIAQKHPGQRHKIVGYAMLPDVFDAELNQDKDSIKPNAYGALMDLDYLMHLGVGEKVPLEYLNGEKLEGEDVPFNAVFFASNKNANGDTYDKIEQLAEMISLALVTGAGELSDAAASVADNAEKNMILKKYNIKDKRAWASGLGISEITFRATDLSEMYTLKAARCLIDKLRNRGNDAERIASNWIDNPGVLLRENNGRDDVIDYLLSKNPRHPLSGINDATNPMPEVEGYYQSVEVKQSTVNDRIKAKQESLEQQFHQLIVDTLNSEYGVGLSKEVIASLERTVKLCLGEMTDELDKFQRRSAQLEAAVGTAVNELKEVKGKFFKTKRAVDEAIENVCSCAQTVVINRQEIQRRNGAIVLYTWVLELLRKGLQHILDIDAVLKNLYTQYGESLSKLEAEILRSASTFQVDITAPYVSTLTLNEDEVHVPEFVRSMSEWREGVYQFSIQPSVAVKAQIDAYVKNLNGAKTWLEKSVETALAELSDDELKRKVEDAIRRSSPLFPENFCGYTHPEIPNYFYVGVPDRQHTILDSDRLDVNQMVAGTSHPSLSSIGGTDRIIIYRQYGVVPIFALASVADYKREYDARNSKYNSFSYHFDEVIRRRMMQEKFSLMPKETESQDAVALWVSGLIFGLIDKKEGQYIYRDEVNGDPLEDYWCPLAEYRDLAFSQFRQKYEELEPSFEEHIATLRKSKGDDAFQEIIQDAKQNYLEKYSKNELSKAELKDRRNEAIARQIRTELEYVKKDLGN